ncbi:MAG: class I SAM-dependent methyltransferase [Candidatus Eisenbacteria bacterium]
MSVGVPKIDPIAAQNYDKTYYLRDAGGLGGYRIITESEGREFPAYFESFWERCEGTEGMRILDVGCGRGEFAVFAAAKGADVLGVDYSSEAVGIASELARLCRKEIHARSRGRGRAAFVSSDAKALPFSDGTFDRVTSRALLEHLHQWELEEMLREVRRVVKPTGMAVLCTNPNLWYKKYGLHVVRLARRFLPMLDEISPEEQDSDARERDDFHVNEQSFFGLSRALEKTGFKVRTSTEPRFNFRPEVLRAKGGKWWPLLHCGLFLLERVPPSSWIFGENILCKGKPAGTTR